MALDRGDMVRETRKSHWLWTSLGRPVATVGVAFVVGFGDVMRLWPGINAFSIPGAASPLHPHPDPFRDPCPLHSPSVRSRVH